MATPKIIKLQFAIYAFTLFIAWVAYYQLLTFSIPAAPEAQRFPYRDFTHPSISNITDTALVNSIKQQYHFTYIANPRCRASFDDRFLRHVEPDWLFDDGCTYQASDMEPLVFTFVTLIGFISVWLLYRKYFQNTMPAIRQSSLRIIVVTLFVVVAVTSCFRMSAWNDLDVCVPYIRNLSFGSTYLPARCKADQCMDGVYLQLAGRSERARGNRIQKQCQGTSVVVFEFTRGFVAFGLRIELSASSHTQQALKVLRTRLFACWVLLLLCTAVQFMLCSLDGRAIGAECCRRWRMFGRIGSSSRLSSYENSQHPQEEEIDPREQEQELLLELLQSSDNLNTNPTTTTLRRTGLSSSINEYPSPSASASVSPREFSSAPTSSLAASSLDSHHNQSSHMELGRASPSSSSSTF